MNSKYGKVVVLYGGESEEREVSLNSGVNVIKALQSKDIDVIGLDAGGKDIVEKLLALNPDRCYIALHGGDGENGRIQALLDEIKIPYTGSGMNACFLAMDKLLSKLIWGNEGILTPKSVVLKEDLNIQDLEFPLFVKPVSSGSSFGVSKANTQEELVKAYRYAREFGKVIAEEFIAGKEIAVTVVDGFVFPSVWIEPKNNFYDYESKYIGGTTYHCPSGLSEESEKEVRLVSKEAYSLLGCKGCARIDFIYSQDNKKFYLIEANTSPGMTENSLAPMAAKALNYSFTSFVEMLLEQTL